MHRVLIVDDEPILALDLAEEVERAGYTVVGPVASVAAALRLIDEVGCDVGILDVNLGKEDSGPIAAVLREKDIPFVIVSGYARKQQPAAFEGAPFIPKPIRGPDLLAALDAASRRQN
jgi:DNA-binding response OmpR family regulator